jgi:hypothetical protein
MNTIVRSDVCSNARGIRMLASNKYDNMERCPQQAIIVAQLRVRVLEETQFTCLAVALLTIRFIMCHNSE